ncbi:hypothetical protein R5W23_004496 [Gemmata sp. JC673]|uniref:Uncharacterized protein n=1 Tax=Gemmata algarum TaxID=2975278 RepID=A0ABU5F605_9BACT|nr:hypothetical protein [Gemmata algarum]MDY3563013.1 hypothetical protein [Gemmata algarum]
MRTSMRTQVRGSGSGSSGATCSRSGFSPSTRSPTRMDSMGRVRRTFGPADAEASGPGGGDGAAATGGVGGPASRVWAGA